MVSPGHNELDMLIDFYKFHYQCFTQWIGADFAILPMQANMAQSLQLESIYLNGVNVYFYSPVYAYVSGQWPI